MNGFTEDLLLCVTSEIIGDWERYDKNVDYFVDMTRKSGLTTADIHNYLVERGKVCPVCVTTVFNAFISEEGGKE